jgi:hypothetical protein
MSIILGASSVVAADNRNDYGNIYMRIYRRIDCSPGDAVSSPVTVPIKAAILKVILCLLYL